MWADERVTRHITGKPSTKPQTWARMLGYAGHWDFLGYGYWAVEEKSSKSYVGELGFADFKRDFEPSIAGIPEMGWALAPAVHGRGYAKEAMAAALQWRDANLKSEQTACLINPGNLASLALAEKFGFRWAQDALYQGVPVKLFFRNRGGR